MHFIDPYWKFGIEKEKSTTSKTLFQKVVKECMGSGNSAPFEAPLVLFSTVGKIAKGERESP